ncbi:hypothetical protein Cabys_367 [Caldithrix abyssi DSM 13497]|uniref:Uncharacterized protein n=1 Tax=Caldithrix abyssi DSM 13497 TaxID=880073 RepID=A0A1J1C3J5_CALAY|nr:hypothetical protein Cabys_367 [Caldithrix abyssi DSM 13497]
MLKITKKYVNLVKKIRVGCVFLTIAQLLISELINNEGVKVVHTKCVFF